MLCESLLISSKISSKASLTDCFDSKAYVITFIDMNKSLRGITSVL